MLGGLATGALGGLAGGFGSMGGMALGSKMFGNPFQQGQMPDIFSKINPTKLQALLRKIPIHDAAIAIRSYDATDN